MNKKYKKYLKEIHQSRNNLKNFNRNYRLQQKGLYEQSEKLFEPLIDEQKKSNEAIKELTNITTNTLKQLPDPNNLRQIQQPNNPITIRIN